VFEVKLTILAKEEQERGGAGKGQHFTDRRTTPTRDVVPLALTSCTKTHTQIKS